MRGRAGDALAGLRVAQWRPRLATRRLLAALAVATALARTSPADPPTPDVAARVRRAAEKDAEELRRLAKWGDEIGVERRADGDWERSLLLDAADGSGEVHRRLRYVRRDGQWVRDEASWVLLRTSPETHPGRAAEYDARRTADFSRASAARHRDLAAALRALGADAEADAQVELALARDPDDPWCHLALGEVLDVDDGWVAESLKRRRVADGRAAAEVRRLRALGAAPVREEGEGSRSTAAGHPLSVWRLREWRLETDLDDEAAAAALAAADLGARWFRDRFEIDDSASVLPGEARFVLLSSPETYAAVIDGEKALSPADKKFAKTLSAMPLEHDATKGPWVVVMERPDAENAADVCLHYALHLLFQARFRVEAQEGWLYEGLVAYATLRLLGTQASWCVRLEETSAKAAGPRGDSPETWAAQTHALVSRRDDEPLKRLVGASLNELDGPMLMKAWSLLRMLLEEYPEDARLFLDGKRIGLSTERAFSLATTLRLEDLDDLWRRWVLSTEGE